MTVRFDTETIRLITLFENVTNAPVKDCLVNNSTNTVYFIIGEGKVGVAIGKNGNNVKNAEKVIGKNIKIFEFSNDICSFVRNLIPQANDVRVINEGGKTLVEVRIDKSDRALVIGRDRKNIKLFKELLKRNHSVDDLIVR